MNKSYYPYFLSASLMVVILGAAIIGYFAYLNLNQIVQTLEEEIEPNIDLILLGEISISLEEMENAIESFVFDEDSSRIEEFHSGLQETMQRIETLQSRNGDPLFLRQLDSLQDLILDKSSLLQQAAALKPNAVSSTAEEIKKIRLQQKPDPAEPIQRDSIVIFEDSVKLLPIDKEKRNFWDKLLGRKKEEKIPVEVSIPVDTLVVRSDKNAADDQDQIWKEINLQLDSLARKAQQEAYTLKVKEYTLYQDHLNLDRRTTQLIHKMESYQVERIKQMAKHAEKRALFTNRYISIFSVMAVFILLMSLAILVIYTVRSRKYQEVLSLSRQSALQTAKEKEQFLANMSHEIRTPMNAIAGFAQLLLKGQLSPSQQDQVSIIKKSSDHLLYILNDILDFTKIQNGNFRLEKEAFDPKELIAETMELLQAKAEEKGLYLQSEIERLPPALLGDPYRLKQILLNLTFNAIKFTEDGGITIRACSDTKEGISWLQLSVMDTGIGIPPEKQESIFSEFEQISASDRMSGSGLGLAICKKLTELQDGQISLCSTPQKGSEFSVKIPYEITDKVIRLTKGESVYDLSGLRILIADDEIFNRKLLATVLDEFDLRYEECPDGRSAYERLQAESFDLLLLDFRMPGLSGPELADKIRKEQGLNQKTPIIGLTATVSDQDIKTARQSGIDHILRKPFDTQELLEKIATSCHRSILTIAPKVSDTSFDFSLSNLQKMGDQAFVMDMIETFITSTTKNLEELEVAFESGDQITAAELLHKIIAPARHFGVPALVKEMKSAELNLRANKMLAPGQAEDIIKKIQSLIDSLQLYLSQSEKPHE